MAVKMDKFLLQYFMQLHFNEMPPEKRKTFIKYIEAGDDFTADSDMKMWKRDLVHYDNASRKWINNEMPDGNAPVPPAAPGSNPWEMSDDEWKKLYIEFRDAFRHMDAKRSEFTDSQDPDTYNRDATYFLNDNFGDPAHKLFSNVVASPAAEAQIQNLLALLENKRSLLEYKLKDEWSVLNNDFTYDKLVKGIKDKKYNTDSDFQEQLKYIASLITERTTNPYFIQLDPIFVNGDPSQGINGIGQQDFSDIQNGFDSKYVDPTKLAEFKTRHQDLLRIVAKNGKIQERFQSGKISSIIDEAKKKTAYEDKNSPNFLADSKHDTLTPIQRLQEWKKDTYSNIFEKYKMLQGDRLYFSPQASNIVAALDKEKVKPTDGLDGITKAAGNVENALLQKSASAAKHFKWLNKTLGEIKGVMPKAYEGALRNGRQLKAVIEELIIRAVRDGKVEEAKTAMEVISVCKYGLTTSKIMDKLSKEKLTLLSDPKLSINSNDFTKFFGVAMDKTLETMLKGVGYTITAVGNTINKSGSKFKGHRGAIQSEYTSWDATNNAERAAAITDRDTNNPIDEANRNTEQATLNTLDRRWGINNTNIDRRKQQLERDRQTEAQRKTDRDNAEQNLNAAQQIVDEYNQLGTDVTNLTNDIANLNNEVAQLGRDITNLTTQLNAIPTPYANAMEEMHARQLQAQLNAKQNEQTQKQNAITAKTNERTQKQNERRARAAAAGRARRNLPGLQGTFNTNDALWNSIRGRNDRQEQRINDFDSAKARVEELTAQIDRRNQIVNDWDNNHKNQYDELIQYWDFLETGRDSRTGNFYNRLTLSKKKAQSDFDTNKVALFTQYQNDYGAMAA